MVEDTLYTNEIPNPDILIRTSGEIRFSDYMLLQLNHSYLKFLDKLWPEMNGFDTFRIIAMFQYHVLYNKMKESISAFVDRSPQTLKKSERLKQFCRKRKAQTPIMQKPVPEYELWNKKKKQTIERWIEAGK